MIVRVLAIVDATHVLFRREKLVESALPFLLVDDGKGDLLRVQL